MQRNYASSSDPRQYLLDKIGYFNLPIGLAAGIFMFGVEHYINKEYGSLAAMTAGVKQAATSFFTGGAITGLCENLALRVRNRKAALLSSTLVPFMLATGISYGVHNFIKGTPRPVASTVPVAAVTFPTFAFIGHKRRNQLESLLDESSSVSR